MHCGDEIVATFQVCGGAIRSSAEEPAPGHAGAGKGPGGTAGALTPNKNRARRDPMLQLVALARWRLLSGRQVRIPDSALSGRRHVSFRNVRRTRRIVTYSANPATVGGAAEKRKRE